MSVPASTNRFVLIGPAGGNECCVCGFLGDQEDSGGHSCSGVCSAPNMFLYGSPTDDPPGNPHEPDAVDYVPCFPQSCCPCPPTEADRKVILHLTTIDSTGLQTCAAGGVDETVELAALDGIAICSGVNPSKSDEETVYCYETMAPPFPRVPELGRSGEYEKYGKLGYIFTGVDGNACGSPYSAVADLSLCCCGDYGTEVKSGSIGECHTCNYVFTMQFHAVDGPDPTRYCWCPSPEDQQILPTFGPPESVGEGGRDWFNIFTLVSSHCDPFYLEYEATGVYWNCGPCLNGYGLGNNTVTISATITEAP